ncbi:hypothetical protein MRX96_024633 [Rhipicephalus microplus]
MNQRASRATSSRPPPGGFHARSPPFPSFAAPKICSSPVPQAVTVYQVRDEASPYRPPHLDKGPRVVRELRICGPFSMSVAPASADYRGDFACAFTTRPEPPRSSWTISSTRAQT